MYNIYGFKDIFANELSLFYDIYVLNNCTFLNWVEYFISREKSNNLSNNLLNNFHIINLKNMDAFYFTNEISFKIKKTFFFNYVYPSIYEKYLTNYFWLFFQRNFFIFDITDFSFLNYSEYLFSKYSKFGVIESFIFDNFLINYSNFFFWLPKFYDSLDFKNIISLCQENFLNEKSFLHYSLNNDFFFFLNLDITTYSTIFEYVLYNSFPFICYYILGVYHYNFFLC